MCIAHENSGPCGLVGVRLRGCSCEGPFNVFMFFGFFLQFLLFTLKDESVIIVLALIIIIPPKNVFMDISCVVKKNGSYFRSFGSQVSNHSINFKSNTSRKISRWSIILQNIQTHMEEERQTAELLPELFVVNTQHSLQTADYCTYCTCVH